MIPWVKKQFNHDISDETESRTIPQIVMSRLVDQAIFGVAKSALIWPASYLDVLDKILRRDRDGSSSPIRPCASSSSTVSVLTVPLYFASRCITSTASLSFPIPERNRGLSKRVKAKKRMAHRTRVRPPRVKRRYLQPMFSDLTQFTGEEQEKLAISGHATCTGLVNKSERMSISCLPNNR